jgi:Zn-finger nucleic acid-binding protein
MVCPKCKSDMEKVTFKNVDVDRCTVCKGIWFDALEHERLKKLKGSESIDIGDPEQGKKYSDIDRIECPVCQSQMLRMVDRKQPHIWYEACTVCGGVFFDAAEFRDYKERTVIDFFRDLMVKERQ